MSSGHLTIDLGAVAANWRSLNSMCGGTAAAVVKANGYGLGIAQVGKALARAGARQFFVAVAEEGATLRRTVGPEPVIAVFSGHMEGDTSLLRDHALTPMLNSVDQLLRHVESLPGHPFGIQLDTGMNRLGMEPVEWAAVRDIAMSQNPVLIMSHLACADEPGHAMNPAQRDLFAKMTEGLDVPRSLAATGGILLGPDYHFDVTRPGIGIYGGMPFDKARATVRLDLPVIQIRDVAAGEAVGYGASWTAKRPTRIATVSSGYADGLIRLLGTSARLYHGATPCPVAGRVSMDLITVDITALDTAPDYLTILGTHQSVDDLAWAASTIGYEILTSLGGRYSRSYVE